MCFLKTDRVGADLILWKTELHIFAPVKEKEFLLENFELNLGSKSLLPFSLIVHAFFYKNNFIRKTRLKFARKLRTS